MKKLLSLLVAIAMLLSLMAAATAQSPVVLTMGSWENTAAAVIQEMLDAYKEVSGIEIRFEPTQADQYNAALRLQLDNGTGPDLFYSRSYATGQELHDAGFNMNCSEIPGVLENFAPSSLEPWQADDGIVFAVPVAAVSHVVYYNSAYFEEKGLSTPETFEEFLALCEEIKAFGDMYPLANGIASEWDILECVYLGMLPNYVGGPEERALYEAGSAKMNDDKFLKSLEDFAALTKYFPDGFESVQYGDGPALMATGQAAMFIDGSWSSGTFARMYDFSDIGAFAIPAPEGFTPGMAIHPDYAIAGNSATKYPQEVKDFLAWIASPEGAQNAANHMPQGFFPMINAPITMDDELSNGILGLNEGRTLDARFIWPRMMDLYSAMRSNLDAIAKGEMTAQQAADDFAKLQADLLSK